MSERPLSIQEQELYQKTWAAHEAKAAAGSQADINYWFTNVKASTLLAVARVLHYGKTKYGDGDGSNHRAIAFHDHLNHAIGHILEALADGEQGRIPTEDHLANAVCRLLFAIDTMPKEFRQAYDEAQTRREALLVEPTKP